MLKLGNLALCCVLALIGSVSASATPIQWTVASGGNDHWYDLTAIPGNWTDANAQASSSTWLGMTGYLVSILSKEENDFLLTWLPPGTFWIGFTDQAQEGTWLWSSGETVTYSNWNGGEPNNYGGEHFGSLINELSLNGKWNDLNEEPRIQGIIEYNNVPEPTSLLLLGTGLAGVGIAARRRRE